MPKQSRVPVRPVNRFAEPEVRRSFAVSTVAVLLFVVGALLIFSALVFLFLTDPPNYWEAMKQLSSASIRKLRETREYQEAMVFCRFAGGVLLMVGLPAVMAGLGLFMRWPWGRFLGIFFGFLAILFALGNLWVIFSELLDEEAGEYEGIIGSHLGALVFNLVFAAVVLGVLLNTRYAAEFRKKV